MTVTRQKSVVVTDQNKHLVTFQGNNILADLLGISTRQVIRIKKAGKLGASSDTNEHKFKDIANYIREYRPTATTKRDATKQAEYWRAQKLKIEVHQKRNELIPIDFSAHICSDVFKIALRSIKDAIISDDERDEEEKQYWLIKLETTFKKFQKTESELIRETISRYEGKNEPKS